jgi:DNA-binding transcriptional LysR family regulator
MSTIDMGAAAITIWLSFGIDLVRHLRYFAVVADELHFGRAADRLHMAQPPLSQRIQRLERELGVRLFDRSSRRVALSPAGHDLLGPAREVLAAVDRLTAVAALATGGEAGRLRVGLLPETAPATMAAIVRAVERARPAVGLDLTAATTGEHLRALADRMLDVATLRLPADLGALAVGPVLHQPLGVALPAGSPLARRRRVALADLGDTPLALPPRSAAPGFHDELVAACTRLGYRPGSLHHPGGPAAALALALAGTAATLVDRATARAAPGVTWRPLAGEAPVARVAIVWPPARARDGSAVEVVADAVAAALCRDAGMTPTRDIAGTLAGATVPVRPASAVLT